MIVTIVNGENVTCLEVSLDLEFENFIALCCIEIPGLASTSYSDLRFIINGIIVSPKQENLQKKIEAFGLKDGDVVNIEVQPNSASSSDFQMPSSATNNPKLPESVNISNLVANLVKDIKVPIIKKEKEDRKDRSLSLNIFNSLKQPARLDALRGFSAKLANIYEANPSNYEAFHAGFMQHKAEQERRTKLMHDETSEEGQRYIAEMINKENIDFSHQFAMEHMPEAFIPVHMLYIRMKINGHPVIAFVDSGAQVSILSESCSKRCNISRLIDERFQATAFGVGGTQKFLGRIHSCQVQVEGHIFPCPFDVMTDRNIDILFGLNALRRHHCSIDLQKNVLRFGDGTETPFITEEEYRRETEARETKGIAIEHPEKKQ